MIKNDSPDLVLLNTAEAHARVNARSPLPVTVGRLVRAAADGEVRSYNLGGRWLWDLRDVDAYVEQLVDEHAARGVLRAGQGHLVIASPTVESDFLNLQLRYLA